jgi:hypothetical protein
MADESMRPSPRWAVNSGLRIMSIAGGDGTTVSPGLKHAIMAWTDRRRFDRRPHC